MQDALDQKTQMDEEKATLIAKLKEQVRILHTYIPNDDFSFV